MSGPAKHHGDVLKSTTRDSLYKLLVQLYAVISALGHQTLEFIVSCSDVVEIAEKVAVKKKRLVVFHFSARIPPELFRWIVNDAPNSWKVFCVGKRATRSNQKIIVFNCG